jgi:Kef-type K+ transport system membrane component KefB/nucleotide-binding universal stress UspA family protein
MEQVLKPLGGHEVLLVLLQLSAILLVARIGSEIVKRMGLPAVVGELAAGLLLGPTVLGHFFPVSFARLFPPSAEQFHLLEIISWLGMVLLLMLTGIETDVRLLKNLGRSAGVASLFGMAVPFVFGFGLGVFLPMEYVADPNHKILFALFLATAMSISAMPVIAKILMDLDLTKRNIGVVILSAGVVDDTTGWLILSLIAGAASGGASVGHLAGSLIGTAIFLAVSAFVIYPALRPVLRIATQRFESKDTDLVVMVIVTLVCSAATDAIGVHAVFGAFVAGCVLRQVPHLRAETLHKLEAVTFSVFAPVFFGIVGLKVDLWQLHGGKMMLVVLIVATAGKLIGCTAGGLLGGLRFWESLSIAVAMNARGAMGLVVAVLGLSLGLLNTEMYSIIVVMAVVTSFMTPVLLRMTVKMVRMTEEEAARIAAEEAKGMFDPQKLRVLVPTAGGDNALVAARLGMTMARTSAHPATVLYVDRASGPLDFIMRMFKRRQAGTNLAQHLEKIKAMATADGTNAPVTSQRVARDVAGIIKDEATKGYDMIFVGASAARRGVRGEMLEKLVDGSPCHVAIVKHRGYNEQPPKKILVPIDGSFVSRAAIEFAVRYAEGAGDSAEVTVVYVAESRADERPQAAGGEGFDSALRAMIALSKEGGLEKLSPVFKTTKVKTTVLVKDPDSRNPPVLSEAASGKYDLIVLGAENRAIHHRLFFGYENERLVEDSGISVVLVVPRVAQAMVH